MEKALTTGIFTAALFGAVIAGFMAGRHSPPSMDIFGYKIPGYVQSK